MTTPPRLSLAQSAALPYRVGRYRSEVLLVTSRRTRRWVVPKGTVEARLTPAMSAAAEAFEEAGVIGPVSRVSIGAYGYEKVVGSGIVYCSVRVFPMAVTVELDHWPERTQRQRMWMSFDAAAHRVAETGLRRILSAYGARLRADVRPVAVTGM